MGTMRIVPPRFCACANGAARRAAAAAPAPIRNVRGG